MKPDELMARCAAAGIDLILTFQQTVPEGQERALQKYDGSIPKQTRSMRHIEWTAEDAAGACQGLDDRYYAAFAYRFAGDTSQRSRLRSALLREARDIARIDGWTLVRTCANCEGTGVTHEIARDPRTGKAKGKPGEWETVQRPCEICRHFCKVPGRGQAIARGAGRVVVVEQLVDLALFEEWLTVHYVTGLLQLARDQLWPGLIGIYPKDWERPVQRQYKQIQCVIDNWCGIAYSHIGKRMHDDEAVRA